jgi:hypothetical protein
MEDATIKMSLAVLAGLAMDTISFAAGRGVVPLIRSAAREAGVVPLVIRVLMSLMVQINVANQVRGTNHSGQRAILTYMRPYSKALIRGRVFVFPTRTAFAMKASILAPGMSCSRPACLEPPLLTSHRAQSCCGGGW